MSRSAYPVGVGSGPIPEQNQNTRLEYPRRPAVDMLSYLQLCVAPWARARWGNDETGASLVEYALLVALIAVVCIVAIQFLV